MSTAPHGIAPSPRNARTVGWRRSCSASASGPNAAAPLRLPSAHSRAPPLRSAQSRISGQRFFSRQLAARGTAAASRTPGPFWTRPWRRTTTSCWWQTSRATHIEVNVGSAAAAHRIASDAARDVLSTDPHRALELGVVAATLRAYGADSGVPLKVNELVRDISGGPQGPGACRRCLSP